MQPHKSVGKSDQSLFASLQARLESQIRLPQQQWRRWAGFGLIGLVALTSSSVLLRKRSIEAYVTGDVVTITSPIEGLVTTQPVTAGQLFKAGQTLMTIEARRGDAEKLETSELKLKQTQSELQTTIQELNRYQQINKARLKAEVETAARTLRDLESQQRRYASQASRYRELVISGAMDNDTMVGAEAMATSLAQRVGNQRQQVNNLKLELATAQEGQAGSSRPPRPDLLPTDVELHSASRLLER